MHYSTVSRAVKQLRKMLLFNSGLNSPWRAKASRGFQPQYALKMTAQAADGSHGQALGVGPAVEGLSQGRTSRAASQLPHGLAKCRVGKGEVCSALARDTSGQVSDGERIWHGNAICAFGGTTENHRYGLNGLV